MESLVVLIGCIITSIINQFMFYHKTASGEMEVTWNAEDGLWDVNLHMPTGIDYSKKKKLIIKINHTK